ncbi:pantetheine-phosphate adenylyltransferase family protein [Moelleriella libera RCEF 2490]|uniref:Pantetheine-phosphate adenylyltransferase family protein n=1 Tax=Moelleriella libera RCEF 2490 TaxID=1081109 RepID=A0A167XCR8_9HYPO|nr:pantetheine-phosphate adenylyltransferase family protein [Moelleriella libera RCEF 2490]
MSMSNSRVAPRLLLLPAPPEPASADVVRIAYHQTLLSVISRLSRLNDSDGAGTVPCIAPVLVVAVVLPVLTSPGESTTRLVRWNISQSLIAEIYSVVAEICAEKSIATDFEADDPGAVDVRVVLVHHDPVVEPSYEPDLKRAYHANNTAVLDLAAFASLVHPWLEIFYPSSEAGYELLSVYLKIAERRQKIHSDHLVSVGGGLSLSIAGKADHGTHRGVSPGYAVVCLGGTFDHLHLGHKLFLHAASLLLNSRQEGSSTSAHSCEIVIGISSDQLLAKKEYVDEIQPWDIRARAVLTFLSTLLGSSTVAETQMKAVHATTKELHAHFRDGAITARCVDFHDVYGPTTQEEKIQALVVSQETRRGGAVINQKRQDQGWHPLDIYEINVLNGNKHTEGGSRDKEGVDDFASKISSTEIRRHKAQLRLKGRNDHGFSC